MKGAFEFFRLQEIELQMNENIDLYLGATEKNF